VTDLDTLLALVPPSWLAAAHEWAPSVLLALTATTLAARLLLPLARRLELWCVGTSVAWDDGPARALVVALEWLSAASGWALAWMPRVTAGPPADGRPGPAPRPRRDTRPVDREPPDSGAGLALLLVALAGHAALSSGCGSTAVRTHARAATIAIASTDVLGATVDAARGSALDRVEAAHPARGPERDAALDAEHARWLPAGSALDATREALLVWARSIELAHLGAESDAELFSMLAPIASRVVLLYSRVVDVLRGLGVEDAPQLPDAVQGLARALGGGR
jgi:hypothetical protein